MKTLEKTLKACVQQNDLNQCTLNAYNTLSTCMSRANLPQLPLGPIEQYRQCVNTAVNALGAFFLHSYASIYNSDYRLREDLRSKGCNPDASDTFVCKDVVGGAPGACSRTHACQNTLQNPENERQCQACHQWCARDPDICKKLSNGTIK